MTPSADQVASFTANGGFAARAVSTVVLGFVFRRPAVGRVGDAHRLCRLGRAPPDPTPVPRRHRALRRDVPGAGLFPPVLTP